MEFLTTHWHCLLPLAGIAAYLLCAKRDSKPKDEDTAGDWDSR
jgi:hypothetical protein